MMLSIILSILIMVIPLGSIEVIKITSDVVNIRVSNSSKSKVICQAKINETFRYKESVGNWFKIIMYSGNYRFVHKSTAKITRSTDKFSLTNIQVKKFINELADLEEKAELNSSNIDRERELIDCYKLKLFRKKKIGTHLYTTIVVYAAKNNLLY